MKKIFSILLSFLFIVGFLGASNAVAVPFPTFVQVDPTGTGAYSIDHVREFDWEAGGNLVIEDDLVGMSSNGFSSLNAWLAAGVSGSSATFDIHAHARLGSYLFTPPGSDASGLSLFNDGDPAGDYEITATLDGTETAILSTNAAGNLELEFTSISGTFQYYLDSTPDSNPFTGAGFNSGDAAANPFLWGTLDDVSGNFEIVTLGSIGGGSSDIASTITGYNSDYIQTDPTSPNVFLVGSEFETTVEYVGFGQPNAPIVGDAPYTVLADDLVLSADANSSFSAVPEPTTALLLGLGLLGIAAVSRKKMS